MTWSDGTKPHAYSGSTSPSKSSYFQLGMKLTYRDRTGKSVKLVYELDSTDVLTHTIRLEDGTNIHVYNSNLQLIDQTDFSYSPKTTLDSRNEVGTGITLEEAKSLARPRTLSPLQHQIMSWHHRIYHLPFYIIFCSESISLLSKQIL